MRNIRKVGLRKLKGCLFSDKDVTAGAECPNVRVISVGPDSDIVVAEVPWNGRLTATKAIA